MSEANEMPKRREDWRLYDDTQKRVMTATLQRVSPNPKRVLSTDDETRIREALDARDQADENLRNTIVEISGRSSVRVLAEFTGMSTNTISRWKADARNSEPTEHRWWNSEEQRWEYPE